MRHLKNTLESKAETTQKTDESDPFFNMKGKADYGPETEETQQ